jgi:hypothetical protein
MQFAKLSEEIITHLRENKKRVWLGEEIDLDVTGELAVILYNLTHFSIW